MARAKAASKSGSNAESRPKRPDEAGGCRGDALDDLYGILNLDRSTDELIEEMRGPVDTTDPNGSHRT
ncbi:MAG TPA: hypothetical protein VFI91_03790 [Longimicrobiaceae bacterium]|nr:hypothetical protein [Longimicrobiaceae bacterium]